MEETIRTKRDDQRRFLCPECGKHTVLWLLPTTEIKDLPIKCKRCGKESVVSITPEPVPSEPVPDHET